MSYHSRIKHASGLAAAVALGTIASVMAVGSLGESRVQLSVESATSGFTPDSSTTSATLGDLLRSTPTSVTSISVTTTSAAPTTTTREDPPTTVPPSSSTTEAPQSSTTSPRHTDAAVVEVAELDQAGRRRPASIAEVLEQRSQQLIDAVASTVARQPAAVVSVDELSAARTGKPCAVRAVVAADGLDPFYRKVCMVGHIPVVSSGAVADGALVAAADIVFNMLKPRPDITRELEANKLRVGVIGQRETAVMMPEYRDLPTVFPNDDWSQRAYSATIRRPLLAIPEENLLCSPNDTYPGQSVLTHEMGHSVVDLGYRMMNATFWSRVDAAYRSAMATGKFRNSYAATNTAEYWAEGVQDFFDASLAYNGPNGEGNGYDSPVGDRATLAQYDPTLYELVRQVLTDNPWRPSCPR